MIGSLLCCCLKEFELLRTSVDKTIILHNPMTIEELSMWDFEIKLYGRSVHYLTDISGLFYLPPLDVWTPIVFPLTDTCLALEHLEELSTLGGLLVRRFGTYIDPTPYDGVGFFIVSHEFYIREKPNA